MSQNLNMQKRFILILISNKKLDYNQQIITSQPALINIKLIRNLPVCRPLTSAYLTNIMAYLTIPVSNVTNPIFLNMNWSNLASLDELSNSYEVSFNWTVCLLYKSLCNSLTQCTSWRESVSQKVATKQT